MGSKNALVKVTIVKYRKKFDILLLIIWTEKYILENHIAPQCSLTSAQPSPAVLTDVGTKLLQKVKCSWQNGSSKLWFKGK